MIKAAPLFPLMLVAVLTALMLGLERVSLWEDGQPSRPLRLVASNF